jgi:alcohol dehydrogenase (cytochrome c)
MEGTVYEQFSIAFDEDQTIYRGNVFPHASGALLLDWNGRAFAMVLKEDSPNISLVDLTTKMLRRIVWEKNVFGGFPLRSGLEKIKADPPSVLAAELINKLARRGASDVLLEELPRKINSAIDTIHLIDALFARGIWQRSTVAESEHLMTMVYAIAAAKCTHRYLAEEFVRYFKPEGVQISDDPSKSTVRSDTPSQTQKPRLDLPPIPTVPGSSSSPFSNLPEVIKQLNMKSPDTSRAMGALLLDSARSANDGPEAASNYVRLALAFLRGAADALVVRDAIATGSSNRDYAALMANVAVAEDMGAQYGFGSKEAAEKAIYAAVMLGGSPTAYRLAARYAAGEASHDAALGLYARAAAMLSQQDPRERELRTEIIAEFDDVLAQRSAPHSVQIDRFDFTQLAGNSADRWARLAANPRDWIEARLAEEQRTRVLPRGTYTLVTDARLANPEPGNWLMTRGSYKGWSYSALDQINSSNVKNLVPVWSFSTGVDSGHESPPIVNNGVMFVTTPYSQVIALDAATGDLLWRYKRPLPEGFSASRNTNRGVALYGDKVYFAPLDATVVALDAKTGKVVWEAKIEDWKQGYYTTMAPLIVKGKVLVGVAGGEFGVRGFVQAFDTQTGKSAWKTFTIPAPGEPGSDTWKKADTWKTGGASTWMTGNYDPDTNTVYWGTGNGSPWFGDQRPGDNLYTSSTVALDGDTGKIKGHFQYQPNESWDWDEANPPMLVDFQRDGTTTKALLKPARNGYLYWLKRETDGSIAYLKSQAFVPQNVFTAIDKETGRPEIDMAHKPATGRSALFCPGLWGGKDWPFEAYNPKTGLVYIPSNENHCNTLEGKVEERVPGQWWTGVAIPDQHFSVDVKAPFFGEIQAVELNTGKRVWRNLYPSSMMWGSLLTTAGGLVFGGGTNDREFRAFDATTGEQLWHFRTNSGVIAPPSTYTVNGVQYVAVQSGYGLDPAYQQGLMSDLVGWQKDVPQGGVVWVFAIAK